MSRIDPTQQPKWEAIVSKTYAEQCRWILNGFWGKLSDEAENFFQWEKIFAELDQDKHAEGHELDEFWSHKFLERLGETMTVIEMREKFRQIDADFNKRMSMLEYLMYRYSLAVPDVINAPQGENKEEIEKAQAMVDEAQAAVDTMNQKLEDSKKASEAAKQAAAESAKAAKAAAEAEAENKAALEELQAQEKAYNDKKAALEKTKNDESIGVVKRNKAANELDQLLSEDPLPLRKAKINQAAAVKKSERATKAAEAAKEKADANTVAAEKAEEAAAAALVTAETKLQEAVNYLEKVKLAGGVAQGDIWWMQRELEEKKKYLPASRRK